MKTKSICVVETIDADPPTIHTFTSDATGRNQAKECFRAIAREQKTDAPIYPGLDQRFPEIVIEEALSSGHGLSDEDGTWSLQIIESEWVPVGTGATRAAN